MSKIIVLDASGGGNNTGVIGNGIIEKDYNLNLTLYVAKTDLSHLGNHGGLESELS